MRFTMADLVTDLLIYICFGIVMFAIGMVLGYQLLTVHYSKRFFILAKECSDADSVVPLVNELERET